MQYVCDGDDKTWLFDNKYMPVHGGKVWYGDTYDVCVFACYVLENCVVDCLMYKYCRMAALL